MSVKYNSSQVVQHITSWKHIVIKRDPKDPVKDDIYMFKSTLGTVNDLQPGIGSYSRNSAKGTNSYDIQRQIGNQTNPAFAADQNNQQVLADLQELREGGTLWGYVHCVQQRRLLISLDRKNCIDQ